MTLKEKVEKALEDVRPALEAHGGNVTLVDVSDDGVVSVELEGACKGCPMSQMTLRMGIERHLKQEIPEVTQVVGAN
ncbi:MAG: NifU family protein [Acidobacteriota bacterium]|jgi:Fe-S cluster biogenesis protein NfuA|nr:NifU family protein [Acidobacteriota bacterium]